MERMILPVIVFLLNLFSEIYAPHKMSESGFPFPENRGNQGVQLYSGFFDKVIPNYSMIKFSDFSDDEKMDDGNTVLEGIWCQSFMELSAGKWYTPHGVRVPVYTGEFGPTMAPPHNHMSRKKRMPHQHSDNGEVKKNYYNGTEPVFSAVFVGQTVLLRDRDSEFMPSLDDEGLYYCDIANETLVIGVYTTTSYDNSTGPKAGETSIQFIHSNENLVEIQFNVTNGPPTYVTCGGPEEFGVTAENSDQLTRARLDADTTLVSLILKDRKEGTYFCNVTNERVNTSVNNGIVATAGYTSLTITKEEQPVITSIERLGTGLGHFNISWEGSSFLYEVMWVITGTNNSTKTLFGYTKYNNYTLMILTNGLTDDELNFKVLIVGYGKDGDASVLPSEAASTENITLSFPNISKIMASSETTAINLSWVESDVTPSNGYLITALCARLCEQSLEIIHRTVSTFHNFVQLDELVPGIQCNISIQGMFGADAYKFLNSNKQIKTSSSAPTSMSQRFVVTAVTSSSIELSWEDVPCSGQNGPIIGYTIEYSTQLSTIQRVDLERNNSIKLNNLIPYTNYSITVTPYNEAGRGNTSIHLFQKTHEAEPGIISNIRVLEMNSLSILVSWDIPSITNGIITYYDIRYKQLNSLGDFKYIRKIMQTHHRITRLKEATKYLLEVRANTAIGPGNWSGIEVVLVPEIKNISLELEIGSILSITWSPINSTNLLRIILQYKQTHEEHFHRLVLSNNADSVRLPLAVTGYTFNLSIFGIFLIDSEEYQPEETLLFYSLDLSPTTALSSNSIDSTRPTFPVCDGVSPQKTNLVVQNLIVGIAILGFALLIALTTIFVMCYKMRNHSHNNATSRFNKILDEQPLKVKEDTYVEMMNQQLSQPVQYQNVAPSNSHERDQVKSQEMSGVYETIL